MPLRAVSNSSWFITGNLLGRNFEFLLDTGAECTLVHENIWKSFFSTGPEIPTLHCTSVSLHLANGETMRAAGEVVTDLTVGGLRGNGPIIVANIGSLQGVIGLDFLEKLGAQIDLKRGTLQIEDHMIVMHRKHASSCCRIAVTESITIPAQSEIESTGQIKRKSKSAAPMSFLDIGVVECLNTLPQQHGLLLARTIVHPNNGEVPLRIMNLSKKPVSICKGSTVGLLHQAVGVTGVESLEDCGNLEEPNVSLPDHMISLLNECHEDLQPQEYQKLSSFLKRYEDIFAAPDGKLGRTHIVEHTIDTGNSVPVRQRSWRLPFARRQVAEKEVECMLKEDVIQPSSSAWASPIVLVTKKDGSVRFCVDYRKLNGLTRKDAYPLPRITECLDTLAGAKWFCTLDLASGYWQVPMAEKDRPKTAFTVGGGLYEFKVLPFGLCNALATFERLMELVLSGLQWKQCLVYLDDIIVFGDSFDKTLANLDSVFCRLRSAGLTLKPKKCFLFKTSVKFLGHIVSEEGVACDPDKIAAVQSCPTPKDRTEMRHFLGLASYYRRFIPNFSTIAAPLNALTCTNVTFSWSQDCEVAFNQLKTLLTSAPVLSFPRADGGEFVLDTDASNVGIGAVLSQIQDGQETGYCICQ